MTRNVRVCFPRAIWCEIAWTTSSEPSINDDGGLPAAGKTYQKLKKLAPQSEEAIEARETIRAAVKATLSSYNSQKACPDSSEFFPPHTLGGIRLDDLAIPSDQ